MDWLLTCLGNAKGEVTLDGICYELDPARSPTVKLAAGPSPDSSISFVSRRGKLGDSEDSLVFLGVRVDPASQGCTVSARFDVSAVGSDLGWQSGYGIFALDTVASADRGCRHRNMLSVGRCRATRVDEYECVLRAVAGHDAKTARDYAQSRRCDASRVLGGLPLSPIIEVGESCELLMEKTDQGFSATARVAGGVESSSIVGCDFLCEQEGDAIYVGVAVAGDLSVNVSGVRVAVSPGRMSHTPDDEIATSVPDYPYQRGLLGEEALREGLQRPGTIYASPEGTPDGTGTKRLPLDLQSALSRVSWWNRVVLLDGTYRPDAPLVVPRRTGRGRGRQVTVMALHEGGAMIDGSSIPVSAPVMTVLGDRWRLRGLTFQNGPSVGLLICGSHNVVERCEARHNGDTGILVCSRPGAGRDEWPGDNLVSQCDSHHNNDPSSSNADGFGAKLRVGEGNRLSHCIAHHNSDDGFDLYTKSTFGPIGAVGLDGCVAYANGWSLGEGAHGARGTGFKLGGENQPVAHQVTDCVAYDNSRAGFATNSNPSPILRGATAWGNGAIPERDNIRMTMRRSDMLPSWEVTNSRSCHSPEGEGEVVPSRLSDGSVDLSELVARAGVPFQDGSRRRLLFIVPRTSGGGAEKVITSLASSMSRDNEVTLVTTVREDGQRGYDLSSDVNYVNLYEWRPRVRRDDPPAAGTRGSGGLLEGLSSALLPLAKGMADVVPAPVKLGGEDQALAARAERLRLLKEELDVDCSVSFLNSANYLNVLSRSRERCIISIRSHLAGQFAPADCRSEEGRMRVFRACEGADLVVAVSNELANELEDEFGVPTDRLRVIYNGVDARKLGELGAKPLADEGLREAMGDASFVFVSVGRLTQKKGQWHVVRAFSRVVARHPKALLLLLGREGKRDENTAGLTARAISAFGLEGNVRMVGFYDNPHALVAKCDAFVSASLNEGFPNALIEAMAVGVPVISTDCSSGPREIIAPETDCLVKATSICCERYGVLVPGCSGTRLAGEPLEPEEELLAEAMLMLVEDGALRDRLSAASVERARQLSRGRFLSEWREVIEHGR